MWHLLLHLLFTLCVGRIWDMGNSVLKLSLHMSRRLSFAAALLVACASFAYETPEALRYPYVSTYYVQPVVSPEEETAVDFFVTDWDNSKVRFGDDSHRFTAHLKYSADRANWKELTLADLPSGDHAFNLGKLPSGDYMFGIWVVDEEGRPSHTVWHEFRSRTAAELEIPAAEVWRVDEADLADFGVVTETNRYSFNLVEVSPEAVADKNSQAMVSNEMARAAAAATPASGTYAIYAPSSGGKLMYKSWKMSAVAYAADYDFGAVEAESAANAAGLQRLVDAAVARGFRKLVLWPGTYRVSGYSTVTIPSGLTLDLNGSTVKMNGSTGSSGKVFVLTHAHDTHLVNGTVEGDYYEHDYAGSPDNSEWVCGISMEGDCEYCSLEDLAVRCVTGYGVCHGTRAYDHTFGSKVSVKGGANFSPGAIRLADGSVDTSAANCFTSDYRDISQLTNGYLMVSKYLGYQGISTKSWYYTAAFYDAGKAFISGEVAFQYRNIPIPAGAKYLRVTVETETAADADAAGLSAQHFKLPWNCAYKGLKIELCRAVGMAVSAMRNMLIEDCDFSFSGDTLATCAFDAEDGWDMMQDVWIHRNVFHDNPNNELLTCAGHNFIIEDNVAKLHLYSRTCCPCVRGNTAATAKFLCDTGRNRTMHGRYENNRFGTSFTFGGSNIPIGWDICCTQDLASYIDGQELTLAPSVTGRIRDCTVDHAYVFNSQAVFDNVTFTNVHFVETKGINDFSNCRLLGCYLQHHNLTNRYTDCTFRGTRLSGMSGGTMTMTNCTFAETYYEPGYWTKPITLDMYGCTVRNTDKYFFRPAVYGIGRFNIADCDFDTGASPAFDIFDLRSAQTATDDLLPGFMTMSCCTCSSGGFVTRAKGSSTSTKHVAFVSCCNLCGGAFATRDQFLPTSLEGLWTVTLIPSAGELVPGESIDIPACRQERMRQIADLVALGLSDEDKAAGLDVAYLEKEEAATAAGGLRLTVGVNRAAVEAVTGPVGVDRASATPVAVEPDEDGAVFSALVRTVPGLWYGFGVAESLSDGVFAFDAASFRRADATGRLRLSARKQGDRGFFKVVVAASAPRGE